MGHRRPAGCAWEGPTCGTVWVREEGEKQHREETVMCLGRPRWWDGVGQGRRRGEATPRGDAGG